MLWGDFAFWNLPYKKHTIRIDDNVLINKVEELLMPRKKREWYPGACYHVMGRGNRHCAIFIEKDDYFLFMKLLDFVKTRYTAFEVNKSLG